MSDSASSELQIPFSHVARFVRQLSHDLRNHLNAAELQAAYLKEIATDDEIKTEVQRLRVMVSEIGGALQTLTTSLAPVKLTTMPYEANAFLEDLQAKVAQQFPEHAGAFSWKITTTSALLEIDPQLLQQALLELCGNALQHGRGSRPIAIDNEANDARLLLNLREPKSGFEGTTDNWGREPFKLAKHGHYSLGLHRASNIIEAHGGELKARFDRDAALLVTTVSLPFSDVQQ